MPRLLKQAIIASIFFLIIGSIIYFSFLKSPSGPTPSPGVLIQPLQIVSENLIKIDELDYDFVVEIKNPNIDFGASDAAYELNLFNQDGQSAFVKRGSINLLPGQTRYEVITPIIVEKEITTASFKINNVDWQRLKEFIPQTLFLLKNFEYTVIKPPESGFLKLRGTLFNNSNFDFDRVDVEIVLFDETGKPIAVNKTDIRTFLAKTDRFFEVKWSKPFNQEIIRTEINAYTDVFRNENFIKEHETQEKFQRFY